MKVLQICHKSPYPPREGGPIAINCITQGLLKSGIKVKVLAINTPKYKVRTSEIPVEYINSCSYESVYIDTSVKFDQAFLYLFNGKSYIADRFYSSAFERKIKETLQAEEYDIIQLESIYVAHYLDIIRKYSSAKIVLRSHNIEHLLWQRIARTSRNPLKRFYFIHLAHRLKKFENAIIEKVDGIAAISPVDQQYFSKFFPLKPVITIPVGIDIDNLGQELVQREFPGIFHLGSMDWMPNIDGIRWLIQHVWPAVHHKFPGIKLYLAGRNMPSWLSEIHQPGVVIVGMVEDAYLFMQSRSIMVVPVLSGGGMRVKIIEGWACGNAVIATSIGAEGTKYQHCKNILIADTADEFIKQLTDCINNPELCTSLAEGGRKTVFEYYDNNRITTMLLDFYKTLIRQENSPVQ